MIGESLGEYSITRRLGGGGMGAVYGATDASGAPVAVKVLRGANVPEARDALRRFEGECALLGALEHPSLVRALSDLRLRDDDAYFAMEWVDGEDLGELLARRGALPADEALDLIVQLLEGLEAAHAQGVLHRDIKPANVLVGAGGRIKLGDFGLARVHGAARITQPGSVVGTPHYMSPERAEGQVADERSDLYGVGVLLYELLRGSPPFSAESSLAVLRMQVSKPPPPLPASVPVEVSDFVLRALSKAPGDRFESAAAMLDVARRLRAQAAPTPVDEALLDAETAALQTVARREPDPPADVAPAAPRRTAAAALVTVAVLVGALGWLLSGRLRPSGAGLLDAHLAATRLDPPGSVRLTPALERLLASGEEGDPALALARAHAEGALPNPSWERVDSLCSAALKATPLAGRLRALARRELGRPDDALADLAQAIAAAPSYRQALFERAALHVERARLDDARADAARADAVAAGSPWSEVIRLRVLAGEHRLNADSGSLARRIEQHAQVLEGYDAAVSRFSNSTSLRLDRARWRLRAEWVRSSADRERARVLFAESLKDFREVLAGEPGSFAARYGEALALYLDVKARPRGAVRGEDWDGVLAAIGRAQEADPGAADAHVLEARVLRLRRRSEPALDALERALRLDPDHAEALYVKASLLRFPPYEDLDTARSVVERARTALAASPYPDPTLSSLITDLRRELRSR